MAFTSIPAFAADGTEVIVRPENLITCDSNADELCKRLGYTNSTGLLACKNHRNKDSVRGSTRIDTEKNYYVRVFSPTDTNTIQSARDLELSWGYQTFRTENKVRIIKKIGCE